MSSKEFNHAGLRQSRGIRSDYEQVLSDIKAQFADEMA